MFSASIDDLYDRWVANTATVLVCVGGIVSVTLFIALAAKWTGSF